MALTDSGGGVQTEYGYSPYGITRASSSAGNDFRYTGREFEAEDLNYHRARYYDPTLGRWLREDPIEFNGEDANIYAYVGGNPISYFDPTGLAPSWANTTGTFFGVIGGGLVGYGLKPPYGPHSVYLLAGGATLGTAGALLTAWSNLDAAPDALETISNSTDVNVIEENQNRLRDLLNDQHPDSDREALNGEACE